MLLLTQIANLATATTVLIFLFTLIAAFKQLKQMSRATRLQLLDPVIKQFNSEQSVLAREYVVNRLPKLKKLNDEAKKHIDCVSRDFNDLGFLLYSNLVDEEYIVPNWGMSCIRHWERLKPHIEKIQASDYPHRRIFFRYMAYRSDSWLRQNLEKLMSKIPPFDGTAQEIVNSISKKKLT